jgi:protease-4
MSQPTSSSPNSNPVLFVQPAPPPPSLFSRAFHWFMRSFFLLSLLLNVLLLMYVANELAVDGNVREAYYAGHTQAEGKIAIVRIEGAIVEGFTSFAHQQLRRAARDEHVKAVVLAIDSPGGTVTASDELYHACVQLREGKLPGQKQPKPLVVSMGSVAASGGYYVAVAAETIFAQPTTLTGSIGVYAQLFDVSELAAKHGIGLNMIKKGELKGSGSPFHKMRAEEEREFSELLEHAYQRFMAVVTEGRSQPGGKQRLKAGLRDEIALETLTMPKTRYVRRLADGGGWTAAQALEYGLIDQIGYLHDAVEAAARRVGTDLTSIRVVRYQRPTTFLDSLLGMRSEPPTTGLPLRDVPGATARLWYLMPGFELEGIVWR